MTHFFLLSWFLFAIHFARNFAALFVKKLPLDFDSRVARRRGRIARKFQWRSFRRLVVCSLLFVGQSFSHKPFAHLGCRNRAKILSYFPLPLWPFGSEVSLAVTVRLPPCFPFGFNAHSCAHLFCAMLEQRIGQ